MNIKKNLLILSILLLNAAICLSKTWIVTNTSSFTFNPATLTITQGDTVNFQLASIHSALEVSKSTYDADGNTALSGGFLVPFGGGKLFGLSVGTHYYVCQNHYAMGMKGIIIVNPLSGIVAISGLNNNSLNIYPNPSSRKFTIEFTVNQKTNIEVILSDFTGKIVKTLVSQDYTPGSYKLDVENQNLYGIYFIKLTDKTNVITRKMMII